MNFFLKGLIIGFSIAAPVGPIGLLCINRTLSKGRLSGFISGLGAATADLIYGFIAGFGLTFISSFLLREQFLLKIFGAVFLAFLGIKTFLSRPSEKKASAKGTGLLEDYGSIFLLTITNPMTILSFAAVFAALGGGRAAGNYLTASMLVLGVFTGSAIWWLSLSGGVGLVRKKITPKHLQWINRGSGIIIIIFAILALLSL